MWQEGEFMLKVYYINSHKINCSSNINDYEKFISKERIIKIYSFSQKEDQWRSLLCELLIRYSVCSYLKISNNSLKIEIGRYGKPFIKNQKEIYFNSSHSGKYVVCAISDENIGIDIQKLSRLHGNYFQKIFHPYELQVFFSKKGDEILDYIYSIWGLKECYLKYLGIGMNSSLNLFYFKLNGKRIELVPTFKVKTLNFKVLDMDYRYKLAICSSVLEIDFFKEVTIDDMIAQLKDT